MLLVRRVAIGMWFASAISYGQACAGARAVSTAQMSEQGQAAGALAAKPACERIRVPDLRAVFVARVTRIEEHDGELFVDGQCDKTSLQTVHLRITEKLIGDESAEVVVSAGDLNGFYFTTRKTYLVYAERLEDGTLHVSGYGQTKLITEAKDDLTFLRSYAKRPSGGEIFGRVWVAKDARATTRMVAGPFEPLKGSRIIIEGGQRFETIVDQNGRYRLSALPPGKYRVSIEEKSAVWPAPQQALVVNDKGCAEVNFDVDPFRTQDGTPIKLKR